MLQHSKQFLLPLILCCSLTIGFAQQQKTESRFRFQSINQVGLVNGETGAAFQAQTINGVQHKSWFGGIGLGLDYYRFRSIPVFADVRKTFGHAKNKPFVYANGGMSFTWVTDKEKNPNGINDHFSNGLYLDGGMGYQFHISGKNTLLLSIGYSYKKTTETLHFLMPYDMGFNSGMITPMPLNSSYGPPDTYNYYLHRISIKIGWTF